MASATAFALFASLVVSCRGRSPFGRSTDESANAPAAAPARDEAARREQARIERDFPRHGLVRSRQPRIVAAPDRESETLGHIRRGARIRVAAEPVRGPGCSEGWYALHPRGYVCAGTDVLVDDEPPTAPFRGNATAVDAALPYDYFFVTSFTALYFRPPEGAEWRAAVNYVGRHRYFALEKPEKLAAFVAGELPSEPRKPEVVVEVLPRGNFVASPHEASREGNDWVRTVQGRWVAQGHLQRRTGTSFRGFRLDDGSRTMPFAIANRPAMLQRAVDRGREGIRFVDDDAAPITRYQELGGKWLGRTRLGDFRVHRIGEDRYLKDWYVSVFEPITPDFEVGDDELWLHVDLSEQTLVAYRGVRPFFGTLVSTGMPGHETIRGKFRIERKFVAATMDHLGPEAGADDYRIEDVPWVQYFRDGFALHAAFWHDRFGVARSHGCVNLSPADAHYLFSLTSPTVPVPWHGLPTSASGERGTLVWVTP